MTDWRKETRRAAIRHGLKPDIFERQIEAESNFDEDVIYGRRVSSAGARGIAQFMPATAKGMGVDPLNPKQALDGAARLMASNLKKFGSYEKALRAYNAGPAGVQASYGYAETNNYVKKILGGANPKATGRESADSSTASSSSNTGSTSTATSGFDQAGYQDASKKMMLARLLASSPGAKTNPLLTLGVLSPNEVNPGDFQGSTPSSPVSASTGASTSTTAPQSSMQTRLAGRYASPQRGGLGKIIGTPHSGTHTLGNWQSDNAVDVAMPDGTILQSMEDGVVEKVRGSYSGGASRFDGYQVTVRFKDGNRAFYTHLSKASVKPGQRIRAGQAIGRSGSANGVPHLHLGVEKGDPRKLLRRAR